MSNSISVVIPLYNKASYIEETIKSVLATPDNLLEIIVVNDGSTDESVSVVRAIADSRIKLISQNNGGVSKARNVGIREATGKLVAFLDADDRYQPGFLKAIGDLSERYPQAIAYATSYSYLIDGSLVDPTFSRALPREGFSGLATDFHSWWRRAAFFNSSSVCVNRQAILDKQLFFPEGDQSGEDHDLWFRLAENGEIAYWRRSLVVYRLGAENSLSSNKIKEQILPCYNRLINRVEQGIVPKTMRRGAKRTFANQLMGIAQYHASQGEISQAFSWLMKPYALNAGYYWIKTVIFIGRCFFTRRVRVLLQLVNWRKS